jgi:hypothetical protein
MGETLFILGIILAMAWLIDRAWSLRQSVSARWNSPPPIGHANSPEVPKDKATPTLRKDWLRLGRRS